MGKENRFSIKGLIPIIATIPLKNEYTDKGPLPKMEVTLNPFVSVEPQNGLTASSEIFVTRAFPRK